LKGATISVEGTKPVVAKEEDSMSVTAEEAK